MIDIKMILLGVLILEVCLLALELGHGVLINEGEALEVIISLQSELFV